MFKYLNPINWFKRKPTAPEAFKFTTVLDRDLAGMNAVKMGIFISQTYHSAAGQPNDAILRAALQTHLTLALLGWTAEVICDERNNTYDMVETNKLGLQVHIKFRGTYYVWDSYYYNHVPELEWLKEKSANAVSLSIDGKHRYAKSHRYEHSETDASGVTTVYEGGTSSKPVEHDILHYKTEGGRIHSMYASPEAMARVQQREAEERRRRDDAERVRRESEDRWRRDEDERRNASMFAAAMAPTDFSHAPAPTYEAVCPPPPSYESPSPSPSYDSGSCSSGDY